MDSSISNILDLIEKNKLNLKDMDYKQLLENLSNLNNKINKLDENDDKATESEVDEPVVW